MHSEKPEGEKLHLLNKGLRRMVNIRVADWHKGSESPKTEVGEIDTSAPFQSVKAAVSLFGEVAISRQRSTSRRSRLSAESILDKETQLMLAQKEFSKIKQRLENAESTRARTLADLAKAKRTMDDLSNKLQTVNTFKLSALDTKEAIRQLEEQLEYDKSHGRHNHLLDLAREHYLTTTIELDTAKQQLNKIRQCFDSAMEAKSAALQQAAEAQSVVQANSRKVDELSKEISDMKDAIQQLKFASAQNLQEYENIMTEKDSLRDCYKVAVEEVEKKLLALRKQYDPELTRSLEAKLGVTTLKIEVLREEIRRAHESEMNTVKIITSELNDATTRLQEAADEECSLRSVVNSLRMELEDLRRERKEQERKQTERLAVEEQQQAEALGQENLKLDQMFSEAARARREAEKMNRKIETLKKEIETAVIAAEEAGKRLELVIREVEEAKVAEEKVRNEMKKMSQKQESKKQQDASASKVTITVQEIEFLKRGAGEIEKTIEMKVADIAAQLEEINARKTEAAKKLEAKLKALEEIKTATELAQKSAESAKSVVETEPRRRRQHA